LREIVSAPDQVEPAALAAAREELETRSAPLLGGHGGDEIKLFDLVRRLSFDTIAAAVWPRKKRGALEEYEQAFDTLHRLHPAPHETFALHVSPAGSHLPALCVTDDTGEPIFDDGLILREWLAARISKERVVQFGSEAIVAALLTKITRCEYFMEQGNLPADLPAAADVSDAPAETPEEAKSKPPADPLPETQDTFLADGLLALRDRHRQQHLEQLQRIGPQRLWARFFARMTDYQLILLVVDPLFYAVRRFVAPLSVFWLLILSAVLWVAVETILMATIGTTPGKWLLGIAVRNGDGSKLRFGQAAARSALVFALGNACGIVFIEQIVWLFFRHQLKHTGTTLWDEQVDAQVTHKKAGAWRILAVAVIQIVPNAVSVLAIWKAMK